MDASFASVERVSFLQNICLTQVVANLTKRVVTEGCCQADIRMCSHCLFPVVATSLEQVVIFHLVTKLMTVTDLLQVVPTRLIQAVRNKLLRACCHQLVINILRADDISLVGTTCCESVGFINLVTR